MHIYARTGDYINDLVRKVDACVIPDEHKDIVKGVDILSSFNPTKLSQVILPKSRTTSGMCSYIMNDESCEVVVTVAEILSALNLTLKCGKLKVDKLGGSGHKACNHKMRNPNCLDAAEEDAYLNGNKEAISDNIANKLVEGISGFTIHGTSSPPVDEGVSLFTLCIGINALQRHRE